MTWRSPARRRTTARKGEPLIQAVVFDAYGDAARRAFGDGGACGAARAGLAAPQRAVAGQEQIEYTWVRSLVGPAAHRDFARLTDEALDFVLAAHDIEDAALRHDLRHAYRALSAYPEAPGALEALRRSGKALAILSNGEPAMLADGVRAAGLYGLLDAVLSVESVGVFKPDPRVYRLASDRLGLPPAEIAFVSSNPWDAFGAGSFGFEVFWCNRAGQPDEYGLRGAACEIPDLTSLPARLR